ncbi:unnamed protein product [Calypogeia fissa]
MASYSSVSRSVCLPQTFLSGDFPSPGRAIPSRQVMLCKMLGGAVPSLQLHKAAPARLASSRFTRVQAVEESTTSVTTTESATVTEEVMGGAGGGGECLGCGKAEKLGGCDGEGRIQGGIGAVPGFGWWPIRAFRPCPAFIETGGRYQRIGQSLEEVAFGRKGMEDDLDISYRLKG